jgi:hypothetical protein
VTTLRAGAALVIGLVTEGVGEGFGGMGMGDGVAGAVEMGVDVAEREGAARLAEDGEAEGA